MVLPRGAAADKFQLRCCVAEGEELDDATVKTDAFWAQPAVKAKVCMYVYFFFVLACVSHALLYVHDMAAYMYHSHIALWAQDACVRMHVCMCV